MKYQIRLKNKQLRPNNIKISIPNSQSIVNLQIVLKISQDHLNTLSQIESKRKYIFWIQQLQQQTHPLGEGQQYIFRNFKDTGLYNIDCLTYPKLSSTIQIQKQIKKSIIFKKSNINNLQQVKQERQEELKQQSISKLDEDLHIDKILNFRTLSAKGQNIYLHYFKEQFKIWRNFFQQHNISHLDNKQNKYKKQTNKDVKQNQQSSPFKQVQNEKQLKQIKLDQQIQDNFDDKKGENSTVNSTPVRDKVDDNKFINFVSLWSKDLQQVKINKKQDHSLQQQYKTFLQNCNLFYYSEFKLTTFLHQ